MTTKQESWLELTQEDPIEPDMPICDPHHHFWGLPRGHYFLNELLADMSGGHNIISTVFVECRAMYRKDGPQGMQPIGEMEFVQGIAAQSASGQYGPTNVAAGIVGFADLTLGSAVAPVLEAHIASSTNRFRGIRYTSPWHENINIVTLRNRPKGLLLNSKFREGFACLQKYNLSFDSWLYHTQLMELVDLARAFPKTPIILDHIGTPLGVGPYAGKRADVFQEWKCSITELASWHKRPAPPSSSELAEAMAPYYLWCIKQFGAARCMFESNFPVDKMSYSYTVIWNAFKRISKGFSPEDRRFLLHDTAARVYRLVNN